MLGSLQIFATGGVIALRLRKSHMRDPIYEVITNDYRGETIVFSSEIEITSLFEENIRCQSLRLFMTPLRDDMYVEIEDIYNNQVYLIELQQELFVSEAKIIFTSDEDRLSFTCDLEPGVSIFDDFNTEREVNISLDKNYETIWSSNIGPTTRGSKFKVQIRGMYVYHNLQEMTFQTFFDELQFSFNSDETLKIKLLVQGREVFSHNITYRRVRGGVYQYRFLVKENMEYETDTSDGTSEESSDEEGGGESKSEGGGEAKSEGGPLPPAETPEGMIRIRGFLTTRPQPAPPPPPPMPRRRRMRPRRSPQRRRPRTSPQRRRPRRSPRRRRPYNPNETTTPFRTDFMPSNISSVSPPSSPPRVPRGQPSSEESFAEYLRRVQGQDSLGQSEALSPEYGPASPTYSPYSESEAQAPSRSPPDDSGRWVWNGEEWIDTDLIEIAD